MYISIPFNLKFLLFCISIFIYKSPLFPPFAPSLPWPISLIFSPFFIPFGIFIENTLLLPFTSFNAIFFSVPKYASSRLTFISVSMSFPRIGSCSFIFSGSFSTFPKNIWKIDSLPFKFFCLSRKLCVFQVLSYFLFDEGTDNVLYASFISFIFSSAKLSPTFKSGWYFLAAILYADFISSIETLLVSKPSIL